MNDDVRQSRYENAPIAIIVDQNKVKKRQEEEEQNNSFDSRIKEYIVAYQEALKKSLAQKSCFCRKKSYYKAFSDLDSDENLKNNSISLLNSLSKHYELSEFNIELDNFTRCLIIRMCSNEKTSDVFEYIGSYSIEFYEEQAQAFANIFKKNSDHLISKSKEINELYQFFDFVSLGFQSFLVEGIKENDIEVIKFAEKFIYDNEAISKKN